MRLPASLVLTSLLSLSPPLSLCMAPALAQAASGSPETVSAAGPAQEDGAALRERLLGSWEEFDPGHNYIDIRDDGSFVLYLKKGEIGDMKQLDGTWSLGSDRTFRVFILVDGTPMEQKSTLSFEGEEMRLIDENQVITRHRRRTGELPAEYRW